MDPWERRREDDRLRDERERDRRERDRLALDRLEKDRLDEEWQQHVADRVDADADADEAVRLGRRSKDDRARIRREEGARSSRGGRLQVWPESGTALPSSVQVLDPLDLATYGSIDWRHPTIDDLSGSVAGRFHPADGGDVVLVWPSVVVGHRVLRREQVPEEWTWVSVEGTALPAGDAPGGGARPPQLAGPGAPPGTT